MGKILQKLVLLGVISSLSVGMLTGCGDKNETKDQTGEETTARTEETKDAESTAKDSEERPELSQGEHPRFISDGIRKLVLWKDGKEIFNLSKEPADYKMDFDYWEILNPYDEIITVNTETMYTLFDILTQIDLTTPAAVEEGVDTGIGDSADSMQIDFVDTEDSEEAKGTKYADHTATLLLGNEDGQGNRYGAVKGYEDQVYKIPSSLLEMVYTLNPFDYILKIPALVNIDTVEEVEIKADGKSYIMKPDGESYKMDDRDVEKEEFTALYQALLGVMLDAPLEDETISRTDREEMLSVVFKRNVENAPEVTLTYYAYDDTYNSISINGTERFLVKAEDVDALLEQIKEAF